MSSDSKQQVRSQNKIAFVDFRWSDKEQITGYDQVGNTTSHSTI